VTGQGPDLPAGAFVIDPRGRHRHRYARRGLGPTTWLFVVVEYDYRGLGIVVTAFPKRRLPGH